MDVKEIVRYMSYSFFSIFTACVLVRYVYALVSGSGTFGVHDITALLVMAVFGTLSYFIFYSKKELSRKQMLMRNVIHMSVIIGVMLLIASYMQWILWNEPIRIIVFVGVVVLVYVMIVVVNVLHDKKTADQMTQNLNERFK